MARLLYMKVKGGETGVAEFNELQDYYDKLECSCFDIAHLKIGTKFFDLFVDDNGLLKDNPLPSAVNKKDLSVMLVGNIVFANHNSAGETTSLTDDEIEMIKNEMISGIIFNENGDPLEIKSVYASYQ